MSRLATVALIGITGCRYYDRVPGDDRLPPLPREAIADAGGRFDQGMERLLGPDRRFDPDLARAILGS